MNANPTVKRRSFLSGAAATVMAAGAASSFPMPAFAQGKRQWRVVLTWPKNSPGLGRSAQRLMKSIDTLSEGRLTVKVYGGGELVPPFEVFDTVREGKAQMGHGMAYYWIGKNKATAFFAAVPGGLIPDEQNAWLYQGGGLKLWDELYGQYDLKPFPCGTFAHQMVGWFRKPIESLDDLKGLKIRISGLTVDVMNRLGATAVQLPVGELMAALQSGTIDAAEWAGGWHDLAFGFYKVAKFFHGPGFHEPGSTMELIINKKEWEALPKDLQYIVEIACRAENINHLALNTYHQIGALETLEQKHGVKVLPLPDDVMRAFIKTSNEVVAEVGQSSELAKRIYASWSKFRSARIKYAPAMTEGYLKHRSLAASS